MREITAAAATVVGGCLGQVFKPQPMEKKPGWRGSPGTLPSAPLPMLLLLPPHPLVSYARVPVRLHLHRQPPVHTEHTQLPPAWTHLARAFCKRWYCPDCAALLLTPSSFPASLPSLLLFLPFLLLSLSVLSLSLRQGFTLPSRLTSKSQSCLCHITVGIWHHPWL